MSFYNDNQNTDPKNNLGGSKNATADKKGDCKRIQEVIEKSLLTLTDRLLIMIQQKFIAKENEKLRKRKKLSHFLFPI